MLGIRSLCSNMTGNPLQGVFHLDGPLLSNRELLLQNSAVCTSSNLFWRRFISKPAGPLKLKSVSGVHSAAAMQLVH